MKTFKSHWLIVFIVSAMIIVFGVLGYVVDNHDTVAEVVPGMTDDYKEADFIPIMDAMADDVINEFAETGHWGHELQDGCDFRCRLDRAGWGNGMSFGENLFLGTCDSEFAHKLFMESPDHRANIEHGYEFERMYQYDVEGTDKCLQVYIYAERT